MKTFALIGIAGYIAPRHLSAIKETGNTLVAALDKFDSVGILDNYFPNADFFNEFERFDRHIDKLRRNGSKVDYVSICTPNYLHDSHIRFTLRQNADAICEKPLVLNPWNAEALMEIEKETGKKVFNILQLRHHPSIINLKETVQKETKIVDIDLTYITSRGNWYYNSWKGDISKSGGIATNIGIHFFDMLGWIFGKASTNVIHLAEQDRVAGYLEFEKARVRWMLSTNYDLLPESIKKQGKRTYRSLTMNGKEVEFSDGFTELHTRSYQEILNDKGWSIQDTLQSIEIAHQIRTSLPVGLKGEYHPFLK